MKIAGLTKLTLLDFPEVVACIVFTAGCNFRCPFCHNASLVTGDLSASIDENEVLDFLKRRQGILEGVVVTGGEPLLQGDIESFLEKIKALGYKIKLDTNGTNPSLLKRLVDKGLVDYVAMDIKNSPDGYSLAIGIENFDMSKVEESKNFLLSGAVPYEFRTTLVKGIHTKDSLKDLARFISGAKNYYLQQFKDSGDLISPEGLSAFSKDEMQELSKEVSPFVKAVILRGI